MTFARPYALLFCLLPLAACATGSGATTAEIEAGATVFADNCAVCHGADATGGSGPSLVGEIEGNESEDTIINGEGDMPAFGDVLTDTEISDVIAYLESLGGGGEEEGDDD